MVSVSYFLIIFVYLSNSRKNLVYSMPEKVAVLELKLNIFLLPEFVGVKFWMNTAKVDGKVDSR